MNNFYMKEAEEIIGIKFNEPKLLLTALTHSSYAINIEMKSIMKDLSF